MTTVIDKPNFTLPTTPAQQQRAVVRTLNREGAKWMAIEALARQMTDISSGNMTADKIEHLQLCAEAILYHVEDARKAVADIACHVHDLAVNHG